MSTKDDTTNNIAANPNCSGPISLATMMLRTSEMPCPNIVPAEMIIALETRVPRRPDSPGTECAVLLADSRAIDKGATDMVKLT
jgi:hypothetical protein